MNAYICVLSCRLNRASQTYLFPIHLTDQLLPSAVFYATVGPLVMYLAVQKLIIIPYVRSQKEQYVQSSFQTQLELHVRWGIQHSGCMGEKLRTNCMRALVKMSQQAISGIDLMMS